MKGTHDWLCLKGCLALRIRTKLTLFVLSLVVIALLVSHAIVHIQTEHTIIKDVLSHLESVASMQENHLQRILDQNNERLALVASRTQLRLSLVSFLENRDPKHQQKMNKILLDAQNSIPDFETISVLSLKGEVVASTNIDLLGADFSDREPFLLGQSSPSKPLLSLNENQLLMHLSAPLYLDQHEIGVVLIRTHPNDLLSLAREYTGLGETGEMLLAEKNGDHIKFLTPLRFDPHAALRRKMLLSNNNMAIIQAFEGKERLLTDATDYRGQRVFASIRNLENSDWAMVIKIDRAEALAPVQALKRQLLGVLCVLLVFSVILSLWASRTVTRPLNRLTSIASRVGAGDFSQRFEPITKDDIGQFGKALNETIQNLADAHAKLRESEHRYRFLFDHSPLGYLLTSATGTIIDANNTSCEMFGYSREEIVNRSPEALIPDDFERMRKRVNDSKNINEPFHLITDAVTEDGKSFPIEMHGVAVRFHGSRGNLIILQDISKRVAEEETERQMQERMAQTQRLESLGVLAGGIAHDFNNLLMAIMGHADLAREDATAKAIDTDNIDQIIKASKRAADLCNQMLAYAGKGTFVLQDISLSRQIRETTHMLRASISKKCSLHLELNDNVPLIKGDPTQIHQILMNLVINASEAIGEENGTITITSGTKECRLDTPDESDIIAIPNAGKYLFVKVTDTGKGIDPGAMQHLFEPFYTTKFTGRGLGLPVVLGIVRRHKGALKVQSEPGKGTSFEVFIPAIITSDNDAPASPSTANLDTWQGSGTVLLVDDEEDVRIVTEKLLEKLGLNVLMAKDGREAVEIYRERKTEIDLVLLDMTMPRMNGEEAYQALRSIDPAVSIILASGYSESEITDKFEGKDLVGILQKPYETNDLIPLLSKLFKTL